MNRKPLLALLIIFGAAAAGIVLLTLKGRNSAIRQTAGPRQNSSAVSGVAQTKTVADEAAQRLGETTRSLNSVSDLAARKQALQQLATWLAGMPTNEQARAIQAFLESKSDASTGLGFKIGGRGTLKEAPTLRTWLLDYLGQIDPAAAAAYAKTILNESASSDEWAVAMRNLATGDANPESRKFLEDKMRDLLHRDDWQQNPSSGYLEAFDTAVFLGGTNLVPDLSNLVRKKDNPAIAHASYLAMDRLVINDAAGMMNALESDLSLMEGRELTRADFFARADVRDPAQRQTLEAYLLNPALSPAELQQFTGVFPNANYMVSANLLTPSPAPKPGDLVSRDSESLKVVNGWIADPRFDKLRPQLERLRGRLEEFVKQAAR